MASAMAASKAEAAPAPKPQETVFPLPQCNRAGGGRKPRNIDLMLENLKRSACFGIPTSPKGFAVHSLLSRT